MQPKIGKKRSLEAVRPETTDPGPLAGTVFHHEQRAAQDRTRGCGGGATPYYTRARKNRRQKPCILSPRPQITQ